MPNWCENRVNITCDEDPKHIKLNQELVAKFKSETPFNEIFPEPDWENTPNEDGELPGENDDRWFNWRCQNWGTKWDIDKDQLSIDDEDERSIELFFNTAWSPPEGIYNKIITDLYFVSVSWFYHEPGMQIAGYLNNE